MEDQQILSLRQNRLIDHGMNPEYVSNITEWIKTGVTPFKIPIMELKLSNICNFKCRMCWPKDSSKWAQDWDRVEKFYDEETKEYVKKVHEIAGGKRLYNMFETNKNFIDKLVTLMDHVEEIEFAGGEPILDPIHYRVLANVKNPEKVVLKYATNLSTLLLKGTSCISAFNALELDKTAEAIIMELGIQWHTSRLQYPEFQHANVLPPKKLQESIEKLKVTKDIIAKQPGYHKFNLLHIDGAINWLEYSIKNSNHKPDTYSRFTSFNRELDG